MNIVVMGGGSFGTALAHVFASVGCSVTLGVKEENLVDEINTNHENTEWLVGERIHPSVKAFYPLEETLRAHDPSIVIWAVPSRHLSRVAVESQPLPKMTPHIVASKGFVLEDRHALLPHEFLERFVSSNNPVSVLGGPTFARGLVHGDVSEIVGAGHYQALTVLRERLQTMDSPLRLHVYRQRQGPRKAIALGAALKTAYALGAGIVTGAGHGPNTQAIYFRKAYKEMARLIASLGGSPSIAAGPAVLGDFFLTATSHTSRNFLFGSHLGEGSSPSKAQELLEGQVVEGLDVLCNVFLYQRPGKESGVFPEAPILKLLAGIAGTAVEPKKPTADDLVRLLHW